MPCTPGWRYGVMAALLCGLQAAGRATSFDGVSVSSTPLLPPNELRWVPVLFVVLFIAANIALQSWANARPARSVIGWVALAGVVLAVSACFVPISGLLPQVQSTAWDSPALWGLGWRETLPGFILMNGITLMLILGGALCLAYLFPEEDEFSFSANPGCGWLALALLVLIVLPLVLGLDLVIMVAAPSVLLFGGALRAAKRFGTKTLVIILVNVLVYAACLLPYVATGAVSHGSPPWSQCQSYMDRGFSPLLLAYLRANHGRLPTARTLDELAAQLAPYKDAYTCDIIENGKPIMCPAGHWMDRHPRPYTWNAALAGKSVDDLRKLKRPVKVLACPYHPHRYIDSLGVVEAYEDEKAFSIETRH